MNEDIDKQMKLMQTALHDQISSLREEFNKVKEDTNASLEISADLEKKVATEETDEVILELMAKNIVLESFKNSSVARMLHLLNGTQIILNRLYIIRAGDKEDIEKVTKVVTDTLSFDEEIVAVYKSNDMDEAIKAVDKMMDKLLKYRDMAFQIVDEVEAKSK